MFNDAFSPETFNVAEYNNEVLTEAGITFHVSLERVCFESHNIRILLHSVGWGRNCFSIGDVATPVLMEH